MKFFKKALFFMVLALGVAAIYSGTDAVGQRKIVFKKAAELISPIKENPLKFSVMSDIHSDWKNFKTALDKVKEEGSSLIIITGDITTVGKKEEFLEAKKILDESSLPYFVVPGNHDIWLSNKIKTDIFNEVFGENFQSFKKDGIKFILIDNSRAEGIDGKNQGEWLNEEILECPQITCLIFSHKPFNHPTSIYVMGEGDEAVENQARELVLLFTRNKVQKVFSGHLHYSSAYTLDGLQTIIVGAVTKDRNVQTPKFAQVTVSTSGISSKDVFLEN